MSAVAWRYEQPNFRYSPSKSKNCHFCPSDTEICVFGQQSRRFGQNVSRTKFLEYVQEGVCQFSAESVGNFSKSSKFTPQLPSINSPTVFSITLAQGALPKLATLFFWESPTQLDAMTVWLFVLGDIFDERRAAPPAYGRRAWSKFISYWKVFLHVPTFLRVYTLPD